MTRLYSSHLHEYPAAAPREPPSTCRASGSAHALDVSSDTSQFPRPMWQGTSPTRRSFGALAALQWTAARRPPCRRRSSAESTYVVMDVMALPMVPPLSSVTGIDPTRVTRTHRLSPGTRSTHCSGSATSPMAKSSKPDSPTGHASPSRQALRTPTSGRRQIRYAPMRRLAATRACLGCHESHSTIAASTTPPR